MPSPLTSRSFVIVDTETTGTSPTSNQIIEIAILRIENGILVDSYQTLVRPARGVPEFITSVTGIRTEDLVNAPSFDEVALTIQEKLSGAIFVAHNARFDYSFIKNEFKRLDMSFSAKTLCTVKLSRALYPQERHHNLDSIIERFGLNCGARHRAYDDALAVWEFILKSSASLEAEHFAHAIDECLGSYTLPPSIPKSLVVALPQAPGVYIFYGPEHEILYVGKSVNIKARVMSHFSGDYQSTKELALCSQIHDIEARPTSGELSALFLESKLIKELSPIYNRALRKMKKLAVLKEHLTPEGYPSLELAYQDGIALEEIPRVLGIFRTLRQAKDFLAEVVKENNLCPKVCGVEKAKGACFYSQLEQCFGACTGKEEPSRYNERFAAAFAARRLRAWPFPGPVVVKEEVEEFEGTAYVIDKWCIYKTIRYSSDYLEESELDDVEFDYDSYKILARHLLKPAVRRSIIAYSPTIRHRSNSRR